MRDRHFVHQPRSPLGRSLRRLASAAVLASVPLSVGCSSPPDTTVTAVPSGSGGTGGASTTAGAGGGSVGGTGADTGAGGSSGSPGTGGLGAAGQGGTGATGGTAPSAPVISNKAIHRLSNVEYDNSLRDLTGTELRFGDRLVREEAHGFDNVAAALSMSPRQIEDYFIAARQVSADVFANPALRDQVVTCAPDTGTACAETVIRDFGRRVFRRPVTASESTRLLTKYEEARALGLDALGALEHLVHILLSSPQFLYRIELDPDLADTTPHPLDGYELATRLSFALWSTTPDDALLAAAAAGTLALPEQLSATAEQMLADGRSEMLTKNFAAQWFGSRRLDEHVVSASFTEYSPALAASMQQEMELYFAEFLHGDLPYSAFLTTDMNFVDAGLAALYGMSPPAGAGFQKVTDLTDPRSGFLGLAGFLTHTSRETRTSPIIRGSWVQNAILCAGVEFPTDVVVEPLGEPAAGDPPTTVREQMAAHLTNPTCKGCHSLIDPVGLALEHFNAIGRYRATYENGLAIDATGVMSNGEMVDGLASMAAVLTADPQFMPCAVEKFGSYALGETFAESNRDQVVSRWLAGEPTLKNLVKEVVSHEAFRSRKAESP
jgi:hypothetical protein